MFTKVPSHLLFVPNYWIILVVSLLRYTVLAFFAFLIFYVIQKNRWSFKKIQQKIPTDKDYFREIVFSVMTGFIFAGIGFGLFTNPVVQYTQLYLKIDQFGIGYFLLSIVLMIVVHDAYFYWMHRLMHQKLWYRFVHKIHHHSTNPSPWAAMAFHPFEAVMEGSIIVVIAFMFPVHPLAIGIFLLFMMVYNVYGHLGYELYPKGFSKTSVGKWINTSVNHNLHHQYFTGNYGLYFLWWDRWFATLRSDYDHSFDDVKSRRPG